jgi:hypothetical protein
MTTAITRADEQRPIFILRGRRGATGGAGIEIRIGEETVWLTPTQMAVLFERDLSVITRHIDGVIADGELAAEGNLQKMQETPSAKGGALRRCAAWI